ncbi:MAG: hypothetical protein E7451_02955 [Ruminococcaceae bacterium]|nr:hypothetical protein [Oscillospiraceae bacterium]
MTREEILEKSRKENKDVDEREQAINIKSRSSAGAVCLLLGCMIAIVNLWADGPDVVNDVLGAVYFCYFSVTHGMLARFHHKKFDWIVCIVSSVVCICDIVSFIVGVLD